MGESYGGAVAPGAVPGLVGVAVTSHWKRGQPFDVTQGVLGCVWAGYGAAKVRRRGASLTPKALPAASLARDAHGPRAVVDPMHARTLSAQELGGPAGR